jgi:tetratricopeptide (TPR) repeat protein
MYVLASIAAVSLLILLALEGGSFLASTEQRPHMRWFGGLTLLLGAAIALLQVLLLNTTLVYSPEFAALLVQGTWARYVLEVVLGCVAIAAAMLWHVARVNERSGGASGNTPFVLLALAGCIVAAVTVFHIHPLQGEVPQVYAYDMWWPPLVAWLTICAVQAAEALVGITGKVRRPAVTAVAVFGVAWLALTRPEYVEEGSRSLWVILYGVAGVVFLAMAGVGTFRRAEKSWWEWFQAHLKVWRSLRFKSLAQIVGAMLPVLAFGRIVHLDTAGPSFALSALALTWIILAEAFGGEPLIAASRWPIVQSFRENGSIRAASVLLWDRIGLLTAALIERLRPAPSTEQPTAGTGKAYFGSTLVKALIAVALLIVISDAPNMGRTIIYPFDPGDLTSEKSLAQEFPTWILHEISLLQRELTPLMIVANRERDRITAAPVVNEIDAAISKSPDLEYGSVKIPLNLFVTPIQTPVRKLLGARVITGALHGDTRSYSVVATSSAGEIWSASAPSTAVGGVAVKPVDALNTLASRLAFEIVATSIPPAAGLTRSADAFDEFRQGIAAWRQYQQEDWDALPTAIAHFRAAVAKDPEFSLAHYRLGVALEEDARPSAAAEAFTASIAANPTFSPSYVAKAHVLYNFDWYRDRLPTAAAVDGSLKELTSDEEDARQMARTSRVDEARRMWRKVLTLDANIVTREDRAASYFGLCSAAHDAGETRESAYVAYYYCRRAEELYARLHSEDPQVIAAHAMVLDTLGVILDGRMMTQIVRETSDWHCSDSSIDWESVSDDGAISQRKINTGPYLQNARLYYDRALALAPLDSVIRCNAASVAYALGDGEPMKALDRTSDAHQQLADGIPANAAHPLRVHRVALKEYEQAVLRDPANTDARNGYAYRFWQWQYAAAQQKVPQPELAVAVRAEAFAREAVRLSDVTGESVSHQALLQSTFGEVLLAQGRSHEAIAVLRKAKNLAPKHTAFDQVRWDLVQADRCAVAADRARSSLRPAIEAEILQNMKEAAELGAVLDADDRLRESPGAEGILSLDPDPARPLPACIAPPGPDVPLFTLVSADASRREPCSWVGVSARLDSAQHDTWVRIFGHDVNKSIPVDAASYVFLGSTPADTHADYFARLEDKVGRPLSPTYAIDTYPTEGDNTCSRNLITLTFRGISRSNTPTGTR